MEMRINSKLIKFEREKRAWTQEHLASITGLGVRTIQRIEKTGSAAPESLKALASVFDMDVTSLQVSAESHVNVKTLFNSRRTSFTTLFAVSLLIISFFTVRLSLADGVKLDYAVSFEEQEGENKSEVVKMGDELISEGQSAIILIDQLKLEVTPTIQENGVLIMLAVKVFENIDGEYILRAEPKVMTADNEEASIRGNLLSILLTPSIQ